MLKRSEIEIALKGEGNYLNNKLFIRPFLDRFSKNDMGNTSIDVRLGRWFLSLKESDQPVLDFISRVDSSEVDLSRRHYIRFDEKYILHPGRFVLGATLEWVKLPSTLTGSIVGKSTLGRHGLIIETAPVIHPDFTGCLTLELANVGELPIALRPGMPIAQIQFDSAVGKGSGDGKHRFLRRPALGRIKKDVTLNRLSRV
jgi:dCTP deaminase